MARGRDLHGRSSAPRLRVWWAGYPHQRPAYSRIFFVALATTIASSLGFFSILFILVSSR